MQVTIGIHNLTREVTFETDTDADSLTQHVSTAIDKGEPLALTTSKGRHIIIPGKSIAYVEFGESDKRPVGFAQF
ncbi:DUF3107 domain-containing protein [Jonesia denitrificans]|uniref:ATP-binding protein n=1 Tax=Jonesia denitrificans (strain ATCC 14870 / DSM 20603 / BCRC 15368 / CIP 55.134 / JCM 11481 / NBRC 15587 / NCTC 10816 / Prevot 55134) TaxID=471856 RepID=C7R1Q5_JONDD|nr:DUF3107 domain-containing protein [Jonesia denitrificans]ACV08373.1 hypothetical protein Jden_0709 [Jonesia denitrificans DSM 20603]ASE07972.1 DUF3107 domain-containing protein [Jonesia denitrificans]QXB42578.1 DUF3107 domain-containing protein [Jonesia denitrificans]SQH20353.1 Protein of uncharacterised function (DUF3107) [Jonesia denitrificans]